MNASEVAKWITDARFAPYLAESCDDYDDALSLYVWNARVSAAAFETLHHVEVLVRNSIDVQFGPVDPSARPEDTWLDDPSMLIGPARDRVRATIDRIVRDGKRPTRGRVVARLLASPVRQEVPAALEHAPPSRVSCWLRRPLGGCGADVESRAIPKSACTSRNDRSSTDCGAPRGNARLGRTC